MTKNFIRYALSILNERNNGNDIFEIFCQKLIPVALDPEFLPSSGTDAGGDGGIDGWSLLGESGKIKYAFSIDKKTKSKILSEIDKTDPEQYQEIRFFTNQPIKQKTKEDIYKEISDQGIIIYDLEDIIEYVQRHEELGQYIDLPRVQSSITIDYLKKHNQLRLIGDEISEYIPRTVKVWNTTTKKLIEESLLDYCKNLPLFTILQSPAGYGKTCALQQLHQKILNKDFDTELPPVFITLADYTPGSLSSMINEGMRASGDYRCNDFLLLLDGYDEVKDTIRDSLIKEIAQLVNNTSDIRKVILTVRENTYDSTDFENFKEQNKKPNVVMLAPLTEDNIRELFSKASIPAENEKEFFGNTFFKGFSDNIFYVVKFIDYYTAKGTIAGNVTQLFSYIVDQEINRLFKKDKPQESTLESLALYMSLNQLLSIEDRETIKMLGINLPSMPFKFSHKSIQEYLAAQKIARQPIESIIYILAKGNLIIPHLTNTLGFVLNILNTTEAGYMIFKSFVDSMLEVEGNAKRLLQIEADKIDPGMNHTIFKAVMEQESKSGSLFNQPESLIPFALMNEESREKNLRYLIDSIIGYKDTDKFHYHTSVLQGITYRNINSLAENFQEELITFLLQLLQSGNIENNGNLIYSLLYSVSNFPSLKKLKEEDIDFIYNRLLSISGEEDVLNNLCQLLITTEKHLDLDRYLSLYDVIINQVLSESGGAAHFVPPQISDDTYHEPMRVIYWESFIPLTQKFLDADTSRVWDIFRHTIDRLVGIKEGYASYTEFEELFSVFFDAALTDIDSTGFDDTKRQLIVGWISGDLKDYRKCSIWERLKKTLDSTKLSEIIKGVIVNNQSQFFHYSDFLDYYLTELIKTEDDFDAFRKEFFESGNKQMKEFFSSFCWNLTEEHPLYAYLTMPTELKKSIIQSKNKSEEWRLQDEKRKRSYLEDLHIAFDQERLANEIQSIFDYFGMDEVKKEEFFNHDEQETLCEKNQFALYLFSATYGSGYESIEKKNMLEYISESNWKINFMAQLVSYNARYKIRFEDLTEDEIQKCIEWAKLVLGKYPLDSIDSTLLQVHRIMSYVLRNSAFLLHDKEFMDSYRDKLIGLTFSAFPSVLEGSFMVSYDSYSLEYLEQYFSTKRLIAFICTHFTHASTDIDYRKMISVCGYITGHIDEVLPYQKKTIKKEIAVYLENNLRSSYYSAITDCAFDLGFLITDINVNKLADAFVLNDTGDKLNHNYAASFLDYYKHEKTEDEMQHLLKALRLAFDNSSDEFQKKTIAEYYLSMNKNAGDIFIFYADYLLSDDSRPIGNRFGQGGFGFALATSDINHLDKVENLFLYSRDRKEHSDRRDGILNMAISSYKAMAEVTQSRKELEKILYSMRTVAESGHDFLYRQIQEIENAFAERTYQPLSVDEIINLQ